MKTNGPINIPLGKLKGNPNNPRVLRDEKFAKLKKSITDFPDMLNYRAIVAVSQADGTFMVLGGNMRLKALQDLKIKEAPVMLADHWSEEQRQQFVIKDNVGFGEWDWDALANEWDADQLSDWGMDLPKGFGSEMGGGYTEPDDIPTIPVEPVTQPGDVWRLGDHRLMCGDSTIAENVARLMNGKQASLCHADPPYGMGKEADGVENDNLYKAKLDEFQMNWWRTIRPHMEHNGSAYVWGNAPDLWRLWYVGGLSASEYLEIRNEIVWDKKAVPGMASPDLTQYPEASERCLFFQIGKQFLGNINTEDFPDSWEPLRASLEAEAKTAGIAPGDIKRVCGCSMYGHWFSRSQFTLIPDKHYRTLREAYPGHFKREWKELKREWDAVKDELSRQFNGTRTFFDNAHDIMRDVWEFPRVTGEERHGHATPKPVALTERAIRSSCPVGGIVLEPFIGSGSTIMAAQVSGRTCYGMELTPAYVDVAVKRWEAFTGNKAIHEATGRTFEEVAADKVEQETLQG
jgi:DNA modification methylase